ncbi:PKD domain-containing protein [Allomuricauda sp. SCSIO 65647]|uniref:PKD domain-containing protein n=1 Tax=Allomuricauda sp. SCSIO 65647 TaxID=2908843 RepID=UPI001F23A855|nr:PKD domain-containing protein [Muricauda sp. SCSIO 65647]UJH67530.1 PKD domain-containing protein [Muricauda sp. SCSIO 65647]
MRLVPIKARILFVMILAMSFLGCEDDDDANKLPEIIARFTQTFIEDSGTVTFINLSENADSFEWNFGDGTTSTEIDPVKTYETGTYTVTLTASNNAGASSTFEDQLVIVVPESITTPITFDDSNVNYDVGTFGGAAFEIVANPAPGGSNDVASQVGAITNIGAEFEGIFFNLGMPLDLTDDKTVTMNFWSDAPIDVLLKLEEGTGTDTEVTASHGGTGWEMISFDFTSSDSFSRLTLFVDGPGTTAGTFYIDDVEQVETTSGGNMGGSIEACAGGELVNDFEASDDSIFSNFGGGVGTIIDNPDTSVNMSAKVGQYVKNAGEVFGGITIEVDPDIDFDSGVFSIDVYSVAVRQLLFKLEGLNIEVIVPTSGTGWETITYDFSAVAGNMGAVTAITLIMDNGTAGDGSADWTIQFDNIRLCSNESSGGGNTLEACAGGELVNDFEASDDSIFSNFGGGVGTIIDNPDTSVNMSAKVGQYVKNAGEVFGGITIEVDPDIDFDSGVFSIDVYSVAVRQLLFKLEGLNIEVIVPTSGTGWETITYDFSAVAGNMGAVTAITLIMDNGTAGDGSADWTIQFDNIRLCSNGSSGGGGCSGGPTMDVTAFPVDFENCEGFNESFGSLQTKEIVDNPVSGGINTSDKVYQFTKPSGADGFGGFQNVFATGTFTNNSTITFKIYSTLPNQEIRLEIVAIPNDGGMIGNPAPYNQTLTSANEWVEMSFDLSANAFPNSMDETVYTMLVVKPGNIDGGNTPADVTFYVDDFAITAN